MAFTYSFEPNDYFLMITGAGYVTTAERIDCMDRILKDRSLPPQCNILIDVCDVTNSPTDVEISIISIMIQQLASKFSGRVAILNTEVGHSTISNLIALSTERGITGPPIVKAFFDVTEAQNWLWQRP
jgi:hypothetical protein